MKRTNLMKAVVCAVMITLVMTSTVFAGTIGDVIKVRGVATYTKTHLGDVGYYTLGKKIGKFGYSVQKKKK